MVSLEARRNPVNQAAAGFFLMAGLGLVGIVAKLAGAPVVVHAARDIVLLTVFTMLGLLVLRRSRTALIVGTTLVALGCVGAVTSGLVTRAEPSLIAFFVLWYGALLFILVRGIVVLSRQR
jgi:hypothetical protein